MDTPSVGSVSYMLELVTLYPQTHGSIYPYRIQTIYWILPLPNPPHPRMCINIPSQHTIYLIIIHLFFKGT